MAYTKSSRLGRYRRSQVDFAYLSNATESDVNQIRMANLEQAIKIIEPIPISPELKDKISRIVAHATTISIGGIACQKDLAESLSPEIATLLSPKVPLISLLTLTAMNGACCACTNDPDFRLSLQEKLEWTRVSDLIAEGTAKTAIIDDVDSIRDTKNAEKLAGAVEKMLRAYGIEIASNLDPAETIAFAAENIEGIVSMQSETTLALDKAKARIRQLEKRVASLSQDEPDDVILQKDAEIEELKTQLEQSHARCDDLTRKLTEDEAMLKRKAAELDDAIRQAATLPSASTEDDDRAREALVDPELVVPASTAACISLTEAVWGDKVKFSKKAIIDMHEFRGRAEEVWEALKALFEVYLPSCLENRVMSPVTFKNETGFELAMHETNSTSTNKKLRRMRTATIDDEEIYTEVHLKGHALTGDNSLRIYFAYQSEKRRIAIIRCTNHLETMGSKRKGF